MRCVRSGRPISLKRSDCQFAPTSPTQPPQPALIRRPSPRWSTTSLDWNHFCVGRLARRAGHSRAKAGLAAMPMRRSSGAAASNRGMMSRSAYRCWPLAFDTQIIVTARKRSTWSYRQDASSTALRRGSNRESAVRSTTSHTSITPWLPTNCRCSQFGACGREKLLRSKFERGVGVLIARVQRRPAVLPRVLYRWVLIFSYNA